MALPLSAVFTPEEAEEGITSTQPMVVFSQERQLDFHNLIEAEGEGSAKNCQHDTSSAQPFQVRLTCTQCLVFTLNRKYMKRK